MADVGVGSWIERRARIVPDRAAIVRGEASWTYAELSERITRLANALRGLGVARGDRVAWLGPNHPAFLELFFAAARLGAISSPVNHRLGRAAVAQILGDSSPRAALVHASLGDTPLPAGVVRVTVDGAASDGAVEYERLLAESSTRPVDEPIQLGDPCMLPFTSGTTGSPKGIVLTHGNVTWNVMNFLSVCDFRADDVTVSIAPFFRTGGTGTNVLPVLFKGGTVVIPSGPDPDEILRLMERHRVTVGFGNPDLLEAMSRSASWSAVDLSAIRFILTGGAPVPERLLEVYLGRGITLVQGYGLSEAAPLVLVLRPEDARSKTGWAGRPPMFTEIVIVDPDGSRCGTGEVGELLVRGPNVMAGYWNRPDATRQVIDEAGWLHTGDAATMDGDGDVRIVDRWAERYATPGGVVFPGGVERVLARHPSVVDVGVVGIAGEDGIRGAAFVVLAPGAAAGEDELLAFCAEHLAGHQVPASVTFVDALPRSPVGKLMRHRLGALVSS